MGFGDATVCLERGLVVVYRCKILVDVVQGERKERERRGRTQPTSKRVLRALHCSSIPIPTVTLLASNNEISLSFVNGGPGSLYQVTTVNMSIILKTQENDKGIRSRDVHSFLLPGCRKRSRGNEDDADACFPDFFREEVGFCGAGEGHLDAAARLGFDFGL